MHEIKQFLLSVRLICLAHRPKIWKKKYYFGKISCDSISDTLIELRIWLPFKAESRRKGNIICIVVNQYIVVSARVYLKAKSIFIRN